MAEATVEFWHTAEGWGAVRAHDRPGLGFVHAAHIQGVTGYRDLSKGQIVEYAWGDDLGQDGCQWRVEWVRPRQT